MEKLFDLKLIDSTYSAEDAKEVIISLINDKIKFLGLKRLQIIEQQNGDTSHIDKRISELDAARTQLREKLDDSNTSENMLKITSNVQIEVLANELA